MDRKTLPLSDEHLNHRTSDPSTFTSCDRCILNLLRPQFIQGQENPDQHSHFSQVLRQFKHLLSLEGVISLTPKGEVQFMTERAEHLLNQYFLAPDGLVSASCSLPVLLQHWFKHQILQPEHNGEVFPCLPLHLEQRDKQLIIHLISDPIQPYYLLLLEEKQPQSFSVETLELLGLTNREAEVLFWVAKDKSNAAIAKVLGCCEGTVRKHLENLYKKLGVRTRIAAVMVALERLGVLNA